MDFYPEFKKLVLSRPHIALSSRAVENCAYGDYIYRSRNTYLSYFLEEAEDCYYSEYLTKCRDCVDSCHLSACELCYECVDCTGIYNGSFLENCHNCSNCDFCFDCLNCKDCFGCFGLRHEQFRIFNKPYTEEEYRAKVSQLKKNPPYKTLEILQPEFDKHPRLYARQLKGGERSLGDYIYFSKNCYLCYNVRNIEDACYVSEVMDAEQGSRDCVDCNFCNRIELCYECQTAENCNNCNFLEHSGSCSDSEYLMYCYNCTNCFGCVYLMNKQYCILNRQFTPEEYGVALAKIKGQLKEAEIYGKTLADILK